MKTSEPQVIHLKDYQKPLFTIRSTEFVVNIHETDVTVTADLQIERMGSHQQPLVLNGEHMQLLQVKLDAHSLAEEYYKLTDTTLTIPVTQNHFKLTITNKINPYDNKALEGLFLASGGILCTQCEPEGFRKITYYIDRPDMMSVYTVTLIADEATYPVLLSNGNLLESKKLPQGRHMVKWHDPFPKPSYLFAMVAGKLAKLDDTFNTMSGKSVVLEIYAEKEFVHKCEFALKALKEAMRWDELVYNLEYDLERFMIVAVRDFNMGAMENKSLNIFNAPYLYTNSQTATDHDYDVVEAVVAHEYFHNWTGNRVTCRDWFQLCLKEGLTVFRDQQFSESVGSPAKIRIEQVRDLRARQFAEDAGPIAHPVRPESFIEINNFYTSTVYEKGAEICRMLYHYLGAEAYYRGMKLYFERHDGQAITVEDFIAAFADSQPLDLQQFMIWYRQAGTPLVQCETHYDAAQRQFTLTLSQSCRATAECVSKLPQVIPFAVGLIDQQGKEIPLKLASGEGRISKSGTTATLFFKQAQQTFVFDDVVSKPTPSLLRDFSAPVELRHKLQRHELMHLMAHDPNFFVRWESHQMVFENILLEAITMVQQGQKPVLPLELVASLEKTLTDAKIDRHLICHSLALPATSYIMQKLNPVDIDMLDQAYNIVTRDIVTALRSQMLAIYNQNLATVDYKREAKEFAKRELRNFLLDLLMRLDDNEVMEVWSHHFYHADNMTDEYSALEAIMRHRGMQKQAALEHFYNKWRHDPLVVDKWFAVQGRGDTTVAEVKKLMQHPDFDVFNPNRLRGLVRSFTTNLVNFHHKSGDGYEWLADLVILLNDKNSLMAASCARFFAPWRQFDAERQGLMKDQLLRIKHSNHLSRDVYEVVSKLLV